MAEPVQDVLARRPPPRGTGRRLLRCRGTGALPDAYPALAQSALGGTDRPWRSVGRGLDRSFRPVRAAARQPQPAAGAALPRASVPQLQPAAWRRAGLPVRPIARPGGRPPARSCDQGKRRDAVVARRRRAPDAEGRRARGAGDPIAGSARRDHIEKLQPDRNRREPVSGRRAVADPLVRAGAAQPLPYQDRHLPAAGLPERRSGPAPPDRPQHPVLHAGSLAGIGGRGDPHPGFLRARLRQYRPHGGGVDGGRLRPRRHQFRQRDDHGRELRLWPVPVPGRVRPKFVAAYFDPSGCTPMAGSPKHCCGTCRGWANA